MSDDTTTPPGTPGALPDDPSDAAALLGALREQLEAATDDLGRLTTELEDRSRDLAEAEAVSDAVLGATDAVLVLVGPDRRVRALSRGAAELAGGTGSHLGRPLSAVLPEALAAAAAEALDAADTEAAEGDGAPVAGAREAKLPDGGRLAIDLLEGGAAVLVLHER